MKVATQGGPRHPELKSVTKDGATQIARRHLRGINSVTQGCDTNCNQIIRVETVTTDGDTNCNQTSRVEAVTKTYRTQPA